MINQQKCLTCLLNTHLHKQSVICQVGGIVARLPDGNAGRLLICAVAFKPTILRARLQENCSVVVALIPQKQNGWLLFCSLTKHQTPFLCSPSTEAYPPRHGRGQPCSHLLLSQFLSIIDIADKDQFPQVKEKPPLQGLGRQDRQNALPTRLVGSATLSASERCYRRFHERSNPALGKRRRKAKAKGFSSSSQSVSTFSPAFTDDTSSVLWL